MNAALRMVLALKQDRRKYGDPDLEDLTPEGAAGADGKHEKYKKEFAHLREFDHLE